MSNKVPLVVTQPASSSSLEQLQTPPELPPRPHTLPFLTPDQEAAAGDSAAAANGAGFNKERRGSKSCLKVSSEYDTATASGSRSPMLAVGSPARRRSVHFNASPVQSTVEVPASDADKAQRGCGALIGPAPFLMSGKEVYVAPSPDDIEDNLDDIDDEADPEQTQRLALARDIARRQSGTVSPLSSSCIAAAVAADTSVALEKT